MVRTGVPIGQLGEGKSWMRSLSIRLAGKVSATDRNLKTKTRERSVRRPSSSQTSREINRLWSRQGPPLTPTMRSIRVLFPGKGVIPGATVDRAMPHQSGQSLRRDHHHPLTSSRPDHPSLPELNLKLDHPTLLATGRLKPEVLVLPLPADQVPLEIASRRKKKRSRAWKKV